MPFLPLTGGVLPFGSDAGSYGGSIDLEGEKTRRRQHLEVMTQPVVHTINGLESSSSIV